MSRCRIRPTASADLPALAALERAAFSDPWTTAMLREALAEPSSIALVAEGEDGAFLGAVLARHGGRRYQLVTVEFLGETTRHESFEVARRAQLVVRGADGTEEQIRLFGSMLRAGDEHKVFSYVVD